MKTRMIFYCILILSILVAIPLMAETKLLPFGPKDIYQVPAGFPSDCVKWPARILGGISVGHHAGIVYGEACSGGADEICALFGAYVDKKAKAIILIFVEIYYSKTNTNEVYVHTEFLKTGIPDYVLELRSPPTEEEMNNFIMLKKEIIKWAI